MECACLIFEDKATHVFTCACVDPDEATSPGVQPGPTSSTCARARFLPALLPEQHRGGERAMLSSVLDK